MHKIAGETHLGAFVAEVNYNEDKCWRIGNFKFVLDSVGAKDYPLQRPGETHVVQFSTLIVGEETNALQAMEMEYDLELPDLAETLAFAAMYPEECKKGFVSFCGIQSTHKTGNRSMDGIAFAAASHSGVSLFWRPLSLPFSGATRILGVWRPY